MATKNRGVTGSPEKAENLGNHDVNRIQGEGGEPKGAIKGKPESNFQKT